MAERAKILHDGDDQAVRLPKSCRFPDDQEEVLVRREGDTIVLEPEPRTGNGWPPEFLALLGSLDTDLERLPQRPVGEMRNPFGDRDDE